MINLPRKQILDATGRPAQISLGPWRQQQQQQNMAAGDFIRDVATGNFYRNPTTGKFKRSTSASNCCCTPSPCINCAGDTSGELLITFNDVSIPNYTYPTTTDSACSDGTLILFTDFISVNGSLNGEYQLGFCWSNGGTCRYSCCVPAPITLSIAAPDPVCACRASDQDNPAIGYSTCNLIIIADVTVGTGCQLTINVSASVVEYAQTGCSQYSGCQNIPISPVSNAVNLSGIIFDGYTVINSANICNSCGTGTGTSSLPSSETISNGLTNSSIAAYACFTPGTVSNPGGPIFHGNCCVLIPYCEQVASSITIGYGGTAQVSFASGTATGSSNKNYFNCTQCQQEICDLCNNTHTGTGTGTGTSPTCNCGSSTPCEDSEESVSVNLDGLKACDPDFVGLVIAVPRIGKCPNAEWYGTGYFGNVNITIQYDSGCYNLTVIHTPPGHTYYRFIGTSTSLTGTYIYCSGDCMTAPIVSAGCTIENCSSQCGDCIGLGTTFSFTAPSNGQLRLIANDQDNPSCLNCFSDNSGSYIVTFTGGTTGTFTVPGNATNGVPGPTVVGGTVYTGTATGTVCYASGLLCYDADGGYTGGGTFTCSGAGIPVLGLVAQICDAPGIYCSGICNTSPSSVSVDISAFNNGTCATSNSVAATQDSGSCSPLSTPQWDGSGSGVTVQITYSGTCYQLTITCNSNSTQWIGQGCNPTGIFCETSNSTGISAGTVTIS